MAINFILSDRAKTQTIDPTATPQAVATDSSTYTIASLVASVTAEEISGSGYSRPTLTVASNALNVDGVGVLTYNTFTFSASGGDITYDRIALIADSDWLGWLDTGSTTISDGQSKTYQIVYGRGSTGVSLTGQDGVSAFSVTTANYTQPAVSGSVAIALENTGWLAQGCYIYVTNGINSGFYQVDTVDSATQITATNLGYTGSAAPTTVITSPAQVIISGRQGIDGTPGSAATIIVGTVTDLAAGSSPTVTNSGSSSAAVFNFGIPAGATGATGATGSPGSAATITVGAVTGLSAGSSPTVTNSGSSSAAIFNFGIPAGATGATGSVSSASSLTLTQIATPSDPGTGNTVLYSKNDGNIYFLPTGGAEQRVGGGGGSRELLISDRVYYVRSDGNDSNNGLTNNSGGAFLTIQKAIDVVSALDTSTYNVTIQLADGTYSGNLVLKDPIGSGTVTIQGNTGTPANTIVSGSINSTRTFRYSLKSFRVTQSINYNTVQIYGGYISIDSIDFFTGKGTHLNVESNGVVEFLGGFTISGSTTDRFIVTIGSSVIRLLDGSTITYLNSPSCATRFYAGSCSYIRYVSINKTGSPGGASTATATGGQIEVVGTAP